MEAIDNGLSNAIIQKELGSKDKRKVHYLIMADRKQFLGAIGVNPELRRVLEETRHAEVTEKDLEEQRISFAFGNAPASARNITKDSVRQTSKKLRLL